MGSRGWKTSEFWVATVGSLIVIFNNALGLSLPPESIAAVAGVVASYVIGRSVVKKGV